MIPPLVILLLFQVLQGGAKLETELAPAQTITVSVSPLTVTVASGGTVQFTATVTGATDASVTWTTNAGTIDSSGVLTVPSFQVQTTVLVTVTSNQDPTKTVIATVTVTPPPPVIGLTLSGSCPSAILNSPYQCTLGASGGTPPYTFFELTRRNAHRLAEIKHHPIHWLPRMPPGLTLNNGVISGTPTALGTTQMTIQVTDSDTPPASTTGIVIITVTSIQRTPTLPQMWANPHESDLSNAVGLVTKYIHTNGSGDFTCNLAGLQASMDQWAAQPNNVWWNVIVDDALSTATGGKCSMSMSNVGFVLKPKTNGTATGWIIYTSAHPNPTGQTICNHMQGIDLVGPSHRNDSCVTTPGIDDYQHLWEIWCNQSNSNGGCINAAAANSDGYGASHIVIQDAEIDPRNGSNTGGSSPITITSSGSTQQERSNHIGFQRDYMHAWYGDDPSVTFQNTPISNFITLDCWDCWVTWSYFDRIARLSTEGHVFGASNIGPGVKIAQNFAEGGEIGWMSGGNIPRLRYPPSDLEVRDNVWTINPAWMAIRPQTGSLGFGQRCMNPNRKNPFELKEMLRVLLDGNVFENGIGCAQNAQGPTFTVRAFSQNNDTAELSDMTFTNNVVRHTVNGIDSDGRSGGSGNGNFMSRPARRWLFANNLLYDVSNTPQGSNGTWTGAVQRVLQWGASIATTYNCDATRDAAGATTTLSNCLPIATPGNIRTNHDIGDPSLVMNCSSSTFNTNPLATSLFLPPPALDTNGLNFDPANAGTAPAQYVVYANAGPPGETGTCQFKNQAGWASEVTARHNTYVVWNSSSRWSTWGAGAGWNVPTCPFVRNTTIQDEIYMPTGQGALYNQNICGGAAGSAALARSFDQPTLTFDHLILPGASSSTFGTSYILGVPILSTAPNFTIWMPTLTNMVCPGATADANCVGMAVYMNGADPAVIQANTAGDPLVDFALAPSSVYKGGAARQASDGTDMGADMNAIRNAMHRTIYPCPQPGACGSSGGPYPD